MLKFLTLFIKDFCRVFVRSLVYVLIAVIVSTATSYVWSDDFASKFPIQVAYRLNAIRYCSVGIWGILVMFAAVMVVVTACQWFGEDILTNRSYLNHMLPIYTWELVLSKALAGLAVLCVTALILTYDVLRVSDSISIVGDMLGIIPDLSKSDGLDFDLTMFIKLGVYFVLMFCLYIMATAFMSLSLGQLVSRGIGRSVLIFIGFFALVFISMFVLLTVVKAAGITLSFSSIQSIFDTAENTLKCIGNTNLVLSVLFMTGASLILTYRLNV
ncbi:MAG: hypothetical protein IJ062_12515 [Firmicutes bacterium]|nr:hypothetical protein [Bacillota bacterium]